MPALIDPRYRDVARLYASQSFGVRLYVHLRLALRLLKAEQFDELLGDGGTVVDFGCGYGLLSNYLALSNTGRRVLGVDADPARIAVAQATIGSRSNIEFTCADAGTVMLPPMDGVVMTDFLHHLTVPDQNRLLASVAASLRPGGMLLIREVNPAHRPRWKYLCSVLAELAMYPDPHVTKLQNRQPEELIRYLASLRIDAQLRLADRGSPFAAVMYVCRKPGDDGRRGSSDVQPSNEIRCG